MHLHFGSSGSDCTWSAMPRYRQEGSESFFATEEAAYGRARNLASVSEATSTASEALHRAEWSGQLAWDGKSHRKGKAGAGSDDWSAEGLLQAFGLTPKPKVRPLRSEAGDAAEPTAQRVRVGSPSP